MVELVPAEDAVAFRAPHGWPDVGLNDLRCPAGRGSQSGYALLSGAPVVVDRLGRPRRRFERSQVLTHLGTHERPDRRHRGPPRRRSARWASTRYAPREFKPGDVDFVQALANVLGDVVERQLTDDDIRHRALHDPLTGLPNRLLFLDRLEQAAERQRRRRTR